MGGKGDASAPPPFNVLLTTYELVMKDRLRLKKWKYAYIIIDEGARPPLSSPRPLGVSRPRCRDLFSRSRSRDLWVSHRSLLACVSTCLH